MCAWDSCRLLLLVNTKSVFKLMLSAMIKYINYFEELANEFSVSRGTNKGNRDYLFAEYSFVIRFKLV